MLTRPSLQRQVIVSPAPPVSFAIANPEKKQGLSGESQADAMNDLAENTLLALVRTGIGNEVFIMILKRLSFLSIPPCE